MKQIHIIFWAVLFLCSGCNYLDVKPVSQVIPENTEEYRAMLVKAYSVYPEYKSLLTVRSDEAFPLSRAYNEYISVALWDESNPGEYTRSYSWRQMYNVLFYANSVIENSIREDRKGGDSPEQLKAEAYLLRAYVHFELLNLYARPYEAATAATDRGIPLALKIDVEQAYIPSTVEEVYAQVLEDIRKGKELMQVDEQPAATRYRFSMKSAKALEARVRLYRSEWEEAFALAEELLPSCPLADLNDENVLPPYYYTSPESILAMERITNDVIVGNMYMLSNVMDKYHKEKDLRVGHYFIYDEDKQVWQPNKGHTDLMKVTFRSGEIYLIAAEAAAHMEGKTGQAKERLKELMRHRLTPDYRDEKCAEIDGMDREQLIAEIADERVRELALEGHRWYDLRRTTRPEIKKIYTDPGGRQQTAILQANDIRYTIRFPQEAVEANPDLKN